MNTPTVLKHLEQYHDPKNWAFFTELRIGTGFGKDKEQRLDAWAINFFTGKRNVTVGYEIKTSKSDFISEIKKPKKRRAGLRLSNEFYFVVPKGLIKIEDVPPECGLIEVNEDGFLEKTIDAPYRDDAIPTWLFVASIARRLDSDRQAEFRKEQASKIYNAAASIILDRYIDKWTKYHIGSREVPDKILEELKQIKEEINLLIKEMTSG